MTCRQVAIIINEGRVWSDGRPGTFQKG